MTKAEREKSLMHEQKTNQLSAKLDYSHNAHTIAMKEIESTFKAEMDKMRAEKEALIVTQRELKDKIASMSPSESAITSPRSSVVEGPQANGYERSGKTAHSNALSMIEKLQSNLKNSQDKADSIQRQLDLVVRNRDEMADEVVKLSNENEELHKYVNNHKDLEVEMKNLEKKYPSSLIFRYNTVLELLGEKTERIGELEADIIDMKSVFKEQLESLMNR